MITNQQSETFRKLIGVHPSRKITKWMEEQEIFNKYGDPYSIQFVNRVFKGDVANEKVERAIWDYVDQLTREREAEQARQKELLETAKQLSHE